MASGKKFSSTQSSGREVDNQHKTAKDIWSNSTAFSNSSGMGKGVTVGAYTSLESMGAFSRPLHSGALPTP